MATPSILIVDDHQLFADALNILLTVNGYHVMGITRTGNQTLVLLQYQQPDLILMDIAIKDLQSTDGIDLAGLIREKYPRVKILMISMHARKTYLERLLQLNVDGYLLKNTGNTELFDAINTILDGGTWFAEELKELLMKSMRPAGKTIEVRLTTRERDILQLMAEGLSTKDIATRLYVSINTVESHRKNMFLKTGLRNMAHLIKWAVDQGQL